MNLRLKMETKIFTNKLICVFLIVLLISSVTINSSSYSHPASSYAFADDVSIPTTLSNSTIPTQTIIVRPVKT